MQHDTIAPLIKDGSYREFNDDVVQASAQAPVIVDFWSPGCAPCRQLTPLLEQAVRDAKGKVRLVKINVDANPALAQQLRIRSVPSVIAFQHGRPVGAFQGARPVAQIREFVRSLINDGDEQRIFQEAQQAFDAGNIGAAAQLYASLARAEPDNVKAVAGMARCYLANGDAERCRHNLNALPETALQDPDVKAVLSALELSENAAGDAPVDEDAIDGADMQVRYDLASTLAGRGRYHPAAEQLFHILATDPDWNDGAARTLLLKIFEAAGPKAELAATGRRRLAALLFK